MKILSIIISTLVIAWPSTAMENVPPPNDLAFSEVTRLGDGLEPSKVVGDDKFRDHIRDYIKDSNYRDLKVFLLCVKNKIDLKKTLNVVDEGKFPLLYQALLKRADLWVYQMLMSYGADPRLSFQFNWGKGKDGRGYFLYMGYNAAHIAIRKEKSSSLLELLLKYGKRELFLQKDQGGWTAVELAFYDGNEAAQKFMQENFPKEYKAAEQKRGRKSQPIASTGKNCRGGQQAKPIGYTKNYVDNENSNDDVDDIVYYRNFSRERVDANVDEIFN